ncbi:ABC transporter permease [Nocardioides terrisoli]|uniref:ABC transporter permease n=1 Tax=Nocardioides terrisoli TaxID=3388267 RepID=UPI00287B704B|nr:ABC transporter permease [Nocardioides marmorisolisilvae]
MSDSRVGARVAAVQSATRRFDALAWALPALLVAVTVAGGVTTDGFSSAANFEAILRNASIVGIVAVGMSLVTVSGNLISLAAQPSAMLPAVLVAALLSRGESMALTLAVVLAMVLVVGLIQGYVIGLGLNAIVASLAFGTVIVGAVALFSGDNSGAFTFAPRGLRHVAGDLLGAPVVVIVFILVTVGTTVFVRHSVIGRHIILSGANPAAAIVSGVSIRKSTLWAFVGLGITAAIAGVIVASTVGQATTVMLPSLMIDVVTAVLIGGISIQGGVGSPMNAALGAVFISLLNNLFALHNVSDGYHQMFEGGLLLVAILVVHFASQRRGK